MSRVRVETYPDPYSVAGRVIDDRPWIEGGTILDYWLGDPTWVCQYNGVEIPSDRWGSVRPEPGADIRFTREYQGVGELIAGSIAFLTTAAGELTVAGTIVAATIEVGIAAGTSFAANKLFGVDKIGDDLLPIADATIHNFEGIQTTAQTGSPILLVYGDHIIGGNIIASSLSGNLVPPLITGAPTLTIRPSIYSIQIGLCHGPIRSIGETLINGNDLVNYTDSSDVFLIKKLGEFDQSASFFFQSVGAADDVPVGLPLPNDTDIYGGVPADWVTSTMTRAAELVRININHPNGLYYGSGQPEGTIWGVRYKLDGADDSTYSPWVDFGFASTVGETFQTFCEIDLPTRDIYTLQVRRTREQAPDLAVTDIEWGSFTQITAGALKHPGLANVSLRMYTDSDLLSGTPTVTTRITGRCIERYDPDLDEWIDDPEADYNPAWIAIDGLTDEQYGLGQWFARQLGLDVDQITKTELELGSWLELAEYCDELVDDGNGGLEKRYRFDGVFEGGEGGWRAVQRILAVARAYVIRRGFKLGVQFHRDRPPVMIFNRHNMKPGSLAVKYLDTRNRATQYNVRYLNKDRDFTPDVEPVSDFDSISELQTNRVANLDSFGITSKSRARKHGKWRLNLLKFGDRAVSWDAPIKAIFCEVGDIVEVTKQRLNWGDGGSVEAATASTITIDTDVELVDGIEYEVKVQHQADDAIEKRVISSPPGQYNAGSTLTLSQDWDTVPEVDASYQIGSVISKPMLVLVTQIRARDEFTLTLIGIRYDARMHDDTITPIGSLPDPQLPSPSAAPPCLATSPTLSEVFEGGEARLKVEWAYSVQTVGGAGIAESIGGARIYVRRIGVGISTWQLAGTVLYPVASYTITGLATGEEYAVTVIQSSPTGAHLQPGQCDASTITLEGLGPVPARVTGVAVSQLGPLLTIEWDQLPTAPAFYEVRRGESWVLSQPVGTSTTNQIQTDQFAPPLSSEPQQDRFHVRAVSATGLYGGAGFVDAPSLALWFASSAAAAYDGRTLVWTGTKTNLSIVSDVLELTDRSLPGTYETGSIDMGAIGNYRVGAVPWAINTGGPALGTQTYTLGSAMGKRWSLEGPVDPATWIVSLRVEIRVGDTPGNLASAPWSPLSGAMGDVFGVRYMELRLTLATSDTDWVPKINYLAVTAEALP